jgi:uncharacterized protein (TIGR02145 family)
MGIDGSYHSEGGYTSFWSSTQIEDDAWYRVLSYGDCLIGRFDFYTGIRDGFSVRCIQDSESGSCLDPDQDGVCAEDEVTGCMDAVASNFNSAATENDGSCIYPGPAQCSGLSAVTFDGYTYDLVGIGTQCWFAENLRTDTYRNGDLIPGSLNSAQWSNLTSGAQTVYGEGDTPVQHGSANEVENLEVCGRLYNWFAVTDSRGICPTGFHVPDDSEWTVLESALAPTGQAGIALKSSPTDLPPWNGTNSSGFSGWPCGSRDLNFGGDFIHHGLYGNWWSTTETGSSALLRYLYQDYSTFVQNIHPKGFGFSVRCLKDLESDLCVDSDGDGICAIDEVSGCTDEAASDFNPAATEDDGSCTYPGPAQCGGATNVTFDGHTYALVGIGNQCWFKENLQTDTYRNGDPIPGNLNPEQWSNTTSGAQAVFNENSSHLETYGRLYNGYAVSDPRGLCPSGWSVPTDENWRMLEVHLGMTVEQSHSLYWRGTDQGAQIKSAPLDNPPWDGTNSSGFAALPGGYRGYYGDGAFYYLGSNAVWWTSTSVGQQALNRLLDPAVNAIFRNTYDMNDGFSVRCLKD